MTQPLLVEICIYASSRCTNISLDSYFQCNYYVYSKWHSQTVKDEHSHVLITEPNVKMVQPWKEVITALPTIIVKILRW